MMGAAHGAQEVFDTAPKQSKVLVIDVVKALLFDKLPKPLD